MTDVQSRLGRSLACFLFLVTASIAGCASGSAVADLDSGVGRDARPSDATMVDAQAMSCATDDECDDADECNGTETCAAGTCTAGAPVSCDDTVACTTDTCDPGTGDCANAADDTACTAGLVCDRVDDCITPLPCESDATCDDGVFCNGMERCDPAFGCRRGDDPNCDDGFACTVDVCDATTDACGSPPTDSACDDGLVCNGGETCAPTDGTADGQGCVAGVTLTCDDAVRCTIDACDEAAGGCTATPSALACDDGVFCNGAELCDLTAGCGPGALPPCADAIGCTIGRCDAALDACVQDADPSVCADARVCNGDERCDVTGTTPGTGCVPGAARDCSDGLSCTTDSCAEPGTCVHGGSDADMDGRSARGCAGGDDCDDLNASIRPGAAELCDGVDNDCSGAGAAYPAGVDDGAGQQCALGSGARACTTLCGSGGTQTCNSACRLGVCLAAAETCNGCDDNGDGRVDEPGPGSTVECRAGETRTCTVSGCGTVGTQTCSASCGWGRCGATEVCNGCDDDGNGVVDNGFTLGGSCNVGVGACSRTGSVVCRSDGTGTTCSVSGGAPMAELCNAIDDDCDSLTDEPFTELGRACSVGVGACARSGSFVCRVDGSGTTCSASAAAPGTETCNNIDDDCDGTIDDGANGGACDGADIDLCQEGMLRCMAGGVLVCDDATGNTVEVCNGVDDNCNGATDEGCDCTLGTTRSCYGGSMGTAGVGSCVTGSQACVVGSSGVGSMWGTCAGWVGPVAEVCNGGDDDCNGAVDNGNPGGGAACDGADTDLCNEGTRTCTSGALVCSDTTGSTVETCNGADDDCNGSIDDGNPGGGGACDGPDGDACQEGTRSCSGGTLVCSDATSTTVEICNGADDDCNGSVDDGNPGGGAACDGPDTDLCNEGIRVCSGGGLSCNDSTGSTIEICINGVDDDCNPATTDLCGPPNDRCTGATAYTFGTTVSSATVSAANDYTASCGSTSGSPDVAYSFYADGSPTAYRLRVDTTSHDGTMHVHSATSCAMGDEIACNDDFGSTRVSELTLNNLAQGTYYLVVDGFSTTSSGPFTLSSSTTALNNDTCTSPSPIAANGRYIGTTAGRANNYTPSCGISSAPDVVYAITARTTGTITVSTCGSSYDTILSVGTTCGGSTSCDDDTGAGACGELTSVISFAATAGTTYYVVVDGYSSNSGSYVLEVNGY